MTTSRPCRYSEVTSHLLVPEAHQPIRGVCASRPIYDAMAEYGESELFLPPDKQPRWGRRGTSHADVEEHAAELS